MHTGFSLAAITTAVSADSPPQTENRPWPITLKKNISLSVITTPSNRLFYEFIGQEEFNRALWAKGYSSVQIRHRLDIALPPDSNCHTERRPVPEERESAT